MSADPSTASTGPIAFGVLPDGTCYLAPLGVLVSDRDRVCCHLCGR